MGNSLLDMVVVHNECCCAQKRKKRRPEAQKNDTMAGLSQANCVPPKLIAMIASTNAGRLMPAPSQSMLRSDVIIDAPAGRGRKLGVRMNTRGRESAPMITSI